MNNLLRKLESTPLSLERIQKLCPNCTTIVYDELPANPTINTLFKGKDACVVFYELHGNSQQSVGHFSLILKVGKNIEYFSSYGFAPETELNLTKSDAGKMKSIFKNVNIKVNSVRYQSTKDTETCGRWCILRYRFRKMDSKQFASLFSGRVQLTSRDDIGTLATLALIDGDS